MTRELRDPIHGFIERSQKESELIDTVVLQRLRRIRQLAMANLVYPGATHTRFDHSLGVMHVAGRLADKLFDDPEKKVLIRQAALLHDVGHGPFSHVSEDVLTKISAKVNSDSPIKKIHEAISTKIVETDRGLADILSPRDREEIIALLSGEHGDSVFRGLISGPLDADKQDYLLRDSYYCGVKYGVFDLERLVDTLQRYDKGGRDETLAASEDGLYAIEQFVLAKYHMAAQVYRHRIRLITDSMIVRALTLGVEADRIEWLRRLFVYREEESFVKDYLEWDDHRLTHCLLFSPDLDSGSYAHRLFRKLYRRDLFKRVFGVPLRELKDARIKKILSESKKLERLSGKIEEEVAEFLSMDTGQAIDAKHVIVNGFTFKSVKEQASDDESSILIVRDDRTTKRFEEESTLFKSIDETINAPFLEVYAPIRFKNDVEKRRKLEAYRAEIQEIITRCVPEAT